jgi:RimJ/RimL family protein N-acetyltransferase
LRHEIIVEGKTFRLRPVSIEDSEFIIEVRSDPRRSRFIHPTSPRASDQHQWLEKYYERSGDYYFIVEDLRTGEREGAIAIYDLDEAKKCAEWGRWVMKHGSVAAVESAVLIYQVAFAVLNLEMVYCHTVIQNTQVFQFHKTFGLTTAAILPNYYEFDGRFFDVYEQRITRPEWEKIHAAWQDRADWATRLAQSRTELVI